MGYKLEANSSWAKLGINNLNDYTDFVKLPKLNDYVSIDVRRSFERIQKLLYLSYYEYELFQVAHEHSLIKFEMALRLRHKELNNLKIPTKIGLKKLLKWAYKYNLLNEPPHVLDSIKMLRDSAVHPRGYTQLGTRVIIIIKRISRLINLLYQDIGQKEKRRLIELSLISVFRNINRNGGVLLLHQDRINIGIAEILHYEYLGDDPMHKLLVWPIFKFDPEANCIDEGKPIILDCHNLKVSKKLTRVNFRSQKGKAIITSKIRSNDRFERNNWIYGIKKSKMPIRIFLQQNIGRIKQNIWDKVWFG